ncbi:polyhydroxyalkanoic acid system family protein [Janthinobacterium lividum]|uniref:polyhydroxyalkanoic acid system family protein n=1 Tax=Janthinobacterium lividum TaxID=29581 RepID=UPI003F53F270
MADINIVQQHKLTAAKAREAAQQVADKLAQEYDLACAWDGDVLRFERSGVDGSLTLEKSRRNCKSSWASCSAPLLPRLKARSPRRCARCLPSQLDGVCPACLAPSLAVKMAPRRKAKRRRKHVAFRLFYV